MKIMKLLFGKKPDIFNTKGDVEHKLNTNTWEEWKKRYLHGKEYNWNRHSGMRYSEKHSLKRKSSI